MKYLKLSALVFVIYMVQGFFGFSEEIERDLANIIGMAGVCIWVFGGMALIFWGYYIVAKFVLKTGYRIIGGVVKSVIK